MNKKVLLIFAYTPVSVTTLTVHTPPLGIGYIAGSLLQAGHTVKLVDLQVQAESEIFHDLDFDIIGISTLSLYFSSSCELISKIRNSQFRGKIVIGGAHVTALPEQSLRQSGADFVCVGEGEEFMVNLAGEVPVEQISGVGWIENGAYKQNAINEVKIPLDHYPRPAFQLFDLPRYGSFNMAIVPPGTKDAIIISSRGCPFECDFCFKLGRNIRFRSPENILSEVIYLKNQYGYHKFSFIDDCFNADKERAKNICRGIIDAKLGITFTLPSGIRADLLDEELASLMKKAGCIGANIGVESWDDEVRRKMNKKLRREDAVNAVRLLRKHGIICTAFFMMGHYHDTKESLLRNVDAVKLLDADFYQFARFIPLPGSPIYNLIAEEGRILEKDFSKYSFCGDADLIVHPTLSGVEIASAIKAAYRKATFRWRTVITIAKYPVVFLNILRNISQVARIVKFSS